MDRLHTYTQDVDARDILETDTHTKLLRPTIGNQVRKIPVFRADLYTDDVVSGVCGIDAERRRDAEL